MDIFQPLQSYYSSSLNLYCLYNNKFMSTSPKNVHNYNSIESYTNEQMNGSGQPFKTIRYEDNSFNLLNFVSSPRSYVQQSKERGLKLKKNSVLISLFDDNNFQLEPSLIPNEGPEKHISFLQTLKSMKRKSHSQTNIKVLLKTEYSVIHSLIHKYFNYKFYNKQDQYNQIFLIWIDSYVSEQFVKRLKGYQKINHFPNSCELGRKDLLAINLNQARIHMPQQYKFYPKTWVLPRDFEAFNQREGNGFYIIKPHANCQGRGIYLTKCPSLTSKQEVIVQQYIENPLLIDECKFDLRIYVLVRSLDPLRIYVYEEGLCRLATSKYTKPNDNNMKNDKMHLTNYAINKLAPNFVGNKDINEDNKGHKRSLSSTMRTLSAMGYDTVKIRQRIDSIIIRSVLAGYTKMLQSYKKTRQSTINFKNLKEYANVQQQSHKYFINDNKYEESVCFELLGFDIILLQTGQPLLLEINHQPSLVTDSPLDLNIKRSLIMDTINILNIQQTDRQLWQRNQAQGTNLRQKHLEEKQMQNKGAYRRIFPVCQLKVPQASQQQITNAQKLTSFYDTMINQIMFRQFKRLSKLKIINYKTIHSRNNNRTHLSKFGVDNKDNAIPKTAQNSKNSKYQNQQSIALTFYNLFNNSKYHIIRGSKSNERGNYENQLKPMNKGLLQLYEKQYRVNQKPIVENIAVAGNELEASQGKPRSRRQQFYLRKQQAISSKLPQHFIDRQANDSDLNKIVGQKCQAFTWNNINIKNHIDYPSTNKNKNDFIDMKMIKEAKRSDPVSSIRRKQINSSSSKNQLFNSSNPEESAERQRLQSENASRERSNEYRQIYSNSIREKLDKINKLKAIKSNLHKLKFFNFVERTKVVKKAIEQYQNSRVQKSLQVRK